MFRTTTGYSLGALKPSAHPTGKDLTVSAVLFGSISTIADTSELQRNAFNEAFQAHGLDWQWDQGDYAALLEKSGGRDRITEYAESRGQSVDADAIHRTKSEIFQKSIADSGISARPGVVETISGARSEGFKVALVTTTSPENVAALVKAMKAEVDIAAFDLVVDSSQVEQSKPDAAAYQFALESLGEDAQACVAIEDNVGGVQSAAAAGVNVFAFPNQNTSGHTFDQATSRVDRLDFAELQGSLRGA